MSLMSWDLYFANLGRVLRITGCPEVVDALRQALPGWPIEVLDAKGESPAIKLWRERDGYRQYSPELPRGLRLGTPVEAACSLIADLVAAYTEHHPELIGLHCASVEIDGRLVVFPASHRAGKSTLTAAFAAAGYKVFGDDVLALTAEGLGQGLGIAPRLRLPLPAGLAAEMVSFVQQYTGPADTRYSYLVPPAGNLAHHGETRPLGAVVLLARDAGITTPQLSRLAPGDGLLQLLCQNFAHDAPSELLVERLLPLMEDTPCLLLHYSEPLAAVEAVQAALREPSLLAVPCARDEEPASAPSPRCMGDEPWRPGATVLEYSLEEELFLVEASDGAIHRLNPSGRLVWQLLRQESLSAAELAELLSEYYAQPLEEVLADVQELLGRLANVGLISSVATSGAATVTLAQP